ncbi:MAG TPA: VOC family protein [Dehalococcoidia bacterium]|jgi:predicted 3-demethylubiquinone-9 3-methyltransferase (glyoxalase superfamily)|nr:VOC family protein [Dehalococcoidia bacterium]
MREIIPNLWFDNEAEEAAKLYTSIFKDGRINYVTRYPEAATEVSGKQAGSVLTVEFEIEGNKFVALNGGPEFKFNESISFIIECDGQEEIDYYWDRLTAGGGEESQCGWLKDKFGVSWQVTPRRLDEMLRDPDQRKVEAVTAAFLPMRKIDLATIERAYASA